MSVRLEMVCDVCGTSIHVGPEHLSDKEKNLETKRKAKWTEVYTEYATYDVCSQCRLMYEPRHIRNIINLRTQMDNLLWHYNAVAKEHE